MSGESKPLVVDFRKENPQRCNPARQASATLIIMAWSAISIPIPINKKPFDFNLNYILCHSSLAVTFTHITHTHSVSHYHWWRQQWAAKMSGESKPLVVDFRKENPQRCNPARQASATLIIMAWSAISIPIPFWSILILYYYYYYYLSASCATAH